MTDEEIVIGVIEEAPEPAPTPEPEPAPVFVPEPVPEPELEEPAAPVEVITVEDLLDRLTGTDQDETAEPSQEEEPPEEETLEEPAVAEPVETVGMDTVLRYLEIIQQTEDHPALTTPFEAYTVTEGLLLLLFLSVFVMACLRMLRGGFKWLR